MGCCLTTAKHIHISPFQYKGLILNLIELQSLEMNYSFDSINNEILFFILIVLITNDFHRQFLYLIDISFI